MLNTPATRLVTTKLLKKTIQKVANIPKQFWVNCPCSRFPCLLELLSWSLSNLEVRKDCGVDFSFPFHFTNSVNWFGIIWS